MISPRGRRRRRARLTAALVIAALAVTGCSASASGSGDGAPGATALASSPDGTAEPAPTAVSPVPAPSSATSAQPARKPLADQVIGIDPGHNGLNHTDPAFLAKQIWNGRQWENCDTTGTQTASGYTEARFNFNVASYLAADLRRLGATVVLTRSGNDGLGPCVNTRSFIINRSRARVAIDIHADGGPSWGRGFTVLEPVADGPNNAVVASSDRLGRYVHQALLADTPIGVSDYYGQDGYIARDDLAGLNLTTVPKVLIECGNMTNQADAALLTSPVIQRQIARALEAAMVRFLTARWPAGQSG